MSAYDPPRGPLRYIRVDEHLIVVGFMTDECVETTTRVALDYGYVAKIVSDATTTYHAESHRNTISKLGGYGFTQTTDETLAQFAAMPETAPA